MTTAATARNWQAPAAVPAEDLNFKEIMSRFPCGVVAITGSASGTVHALTVGTFFSVSAEPRLIGFCVSRDSTSWPAIRKSGRFGVSILTEDQAAVGARLATSGHGKLAGVPHAVPAQGAPVIEGALASLDCALEREEQAGDHLLILGAVLETRLLSDRDPLVYHRRCFRGLAPQSGQRQQRRGQPDQLSSEATAMSDVIEALLAERLPSPMVPEMGLAESGLQSMDLIRIVAGLPLDPAVEVDLAQLEDLCTIGELRTWLERLLEGNPAQPDPAL